MEQMSATMSFDHLFRRDACIDCTGVPDPVCPTCPSGQVCLQSVQTCTSCRTTSCIVKPDSAGSTTTTTTTASSSPPAGAIAGGIIGGILAIAAITYLVWKFCIKNKRQQYEAEDWVEFQDEPTAAEKDFSFRRDQRASTHTVGSIASTVLTRASNIIQIAYIPGMSTRSSPSTPSVLVPPVPPIPIALNSNVTSPTFTDEHFFLPGDLRDSTYSNMTGLSDRTSYATTRQSYATRNSVASTFYGKNAIVSPVNPQTVIRGRAAVVSVKSGGNTSPAALLTPPVPTIDYDRYRGTTGPPSPAFSVGETFLNHASSTSASRPGVPQIVGSERSALSGLRQESSVLEQSKAPTMIDDTSVHEQGPFADPSPKSSPEVLGSMNTVIEQATKKAHGNVRAGLGVQRGVSPFGDEHETNG